jgi:hypothetical protein
LRFADLDNDGDVEMVQTTRRGGNFVYRFRNAGAPFFCAAPPCVDTQDVRLGGAAADDESQGLAVGDLDGDCKIDVFVANGIETGDQRNKYYLNTTAGIPGPGAGGSCSPIATNANPLAFGTANPVANIAAADADSRKVELVDVDADGDLDAIVTNADANDNWLYINLTLPATVPPAPATALFAAPVPLTGGTGDDAEITLGLAVGDLNRDGKTDVVVANSNNSNRFYLNTGTGATRFSANSAGFGLQSDASQSVVLGDVNRDGFLDAVVTNDGSPSRVHLFDGSGEFVNYPITVPTGLPGSPPFALNKPRGLDLAKLDNDGWLDLVIANTNSQYNLRFLNNSQCEIPAAQQPQALGCDPFRNVVPTITGAAAPPLSGNEDTPIAITMARVTASDGDNQVSDLRLAIEAGTNYTVTIPTGSTPTITPVANYSGPLTVNVKVTDLTDLSAAFGLNVTVTPVPDAPTFTSTAPTTAVQATPYTYAVTTADADVGEARTITAPTKPAWLTLTDAGNGTATLSGTPGAADAGPHSVSLEVRGTTDNLLASQNFTITVADANDAPSFSSTAVVSVTAGTSYSYTVATNDPDTGDTRTITATTLPSWLTLTDNGNGTATLAGTPQTANVGSHSVALRVADAAGASATQTFTVNVAAAAAPPSGGGGGGGGGGSTGLIEVLLLLAGLGALRRRRLV